MSVELLKKVDPKLVAHILRVGQRILEEIDKLPDNNGDFTALAERCKLLRASRYLQAGVEKQDVADILGIDVKTLELIEFGIPCTTQQIKNIEISMINQDLRRCVGNKLRTGLKPRANATVA